jgi:8-oxo-dGTP pyrophosphatase MutT (NUDIX family)
MPQTNRQPDSLQLREGVVVACRRADGRWLLVRRAMRVARAPGRVGFPGGEVEPGESHADAVRRELREELAAEVVPIAPFWRAADQVPGFVLHGWRAELRTDPADLQPDPAEVAEVLWLTPAEAIAHPRAFAGNASFIDALLRSG